MNSLKVFLLYIIKLSPEVRCLLKNNKYPSKIKSEKEVIEFEIRGGNKRRDVVNENGSLVVIDKNPSRILYNESKKEIEIIWFHKGDRMKSISYSECSNVLTLRYKNLNIIYFLNGGLLLNVKDDKRSFFDDNNLDINNETSWDLFKLNYNEDCKKMFFKIEEIEQKTNKIKNGKKGLKKIIEFFYEEV